MRPTRWRQSTHVAVGVVVLVLVAGVVAVGAVFTELRSSDAEAAPSAPPPATASPAIVPVDMSAPSPTIGGPAAALALALVHPDLVKVTGRITSTRRPAPNCGNRIPERRCSLRRSTRC